MKKLNLGTAIYSLIASILFLFAPLLTFGALITDLTAETAGGASILVNTILVLFAPLQTFGALLTDVTADTAGGATFVVDAVFRIMAGVILALAIVLLVKDKVASTAGKILLVICGALIVLFSSFLGFIAGIVGIVGASLLLASNKKYELSTISETQN